MKIRYTLEIREILNNKNIDIFDFDYQFYNNNLKGIFERKFIDYYYFSEIGFETVERFKQRLKNKLNMIAPYYQQLYETEVESKGISFLLNKDLTETFERDITGDEKTKQNNINTTKSSSSSNSESNENSINNNNGEVIDLDAKTPQGKIPSLEMGYFSNANKNTSNEKSNSTSNSIISNNENVKGNSQSLNDIENNKIEKEFTKLVSRGNIGITSSAELLQKWREVLINIDQLIIEECKDLFMQIY